MRLMHKVLVIFAALAASLTLAMPADAATPQSNAAQVKLLNEVMHAHNPDAAFRKLSSRDKFLLRESLHHLTGTTIVSRGGRLSAAQSAAMERRSVSGAIAPAAGPLTITPNSSGCWYWYWYYTWKDYGIPDGDGWLQLNWCSNGSTITSYNLSNVGARGENTNAFVGIMGKYYSNVGWEVRAAVEYHFNFWDTNYYPCLQIRGGATGLHSLQRSCNLS